MMQKDIGYPLPAGDAFTDELACMLVFYPDKPEYRQAFFGAYFYLATWIAWEKESQKKGKDAARAWRLAVEATMECIDMNVCETLVGLLTEIRDNTSVHCCDVVDVSDGDQYTDEVEDGEGDVPQNIIDAGFATGVSDWAGFDDYKCLISHLMVQNLQGSAGIILGRLDGTEAALITITALAAIALTIATAGGAILVYGVALSLAGVAGLAAALTLLGAVGLSSLIDNLAEHYEALVCAIYRADGSLGAVDALKDTIDENFNALEATFLKNLNLGPQLKALYAGRYDQKDIAQTLADAGYDPEDFDCTCDLPLTAPTGWEWVIPGTPSFDYTWHVTRVDDSWSVTDGNAMMSCTLDNGQARWEKNIWFPNIGGELAFYYGVAYRVISIDSPGDEMEMLAPPKPDLRIRDARVGVWQMGVNTVQLPGQEFQDMITAQAQNNVSYATDTHSQIRLEEDPDASGDDNETYTFVLRVLSLQPTA